MTGKKPLYKRVLIKLSGEALMGDQGFGIDAEILKRVAKEIEQIVSAGVQVAIVLGGGNLFRGKGLAEAGMDRITGDHMGMLATVMNSLALQDALEATGLECRVMSAIRINRVCEEYVKRRSVRHLEKNRVVVFAAGTGNPFFTTDTAGALRATEIGADVLMKATKVDGVYDSDPMLNPDAKKFTKLTYAEVLSRNLGVMDATAIVMCQEQKMPLRIFNLNTPGDMVRAIFEQSVGTTVVLGDQA